MVQVIEGQMGAGFVERVLKDLGGRATTKQITEEIQRRIKQDNTQTFGSSLKDTANRALGHMKRDREVVLVRDKKAHEWYYVLNCRFCNKLRSECACGAYRQ